MSKFDAFDAMVVDAIRLRPSSFTMLQSQKMMEAADKLGTEGFRVLDRRLQALRKSGKIRHHKGYWELDQAAVV